MWLVRLVLVAAALLGVTTARAEDPLRELRIDWATYNPLSLWIKQKGLLEKEFAADHTTIRWVQSLGSNKALEFLNAGAIDIGSSAGAAALLARIGGNPIKAVGVFSRPEWTALVTKDNAIATVADLRGKRVAVTRGTDPEIFLIRALDEVGLTERDVELVLLQHADGRLALQRGDVDAWAGLDPMMASAELEDGARLFYRKPDANTGGVIDAREEFLAIHPEAMKRVLKVYEAARRDASAHPDELRAALVSATKLPDAVIARQLERTALDATEIGATQGDTIKAAGRALKGIGIIKGDVDIAQATAGLIDGSFAPHAP